MQRLKNVRLSDAIVVIALLVALAIAVNASEWLRGGFGWRWDYELVPLLRVVPLALATAVYLIGVWLLLRRGSRACYVVVWSIAGSVALVLAGIAARNGDVAYELFARTASLLATGQQWTAAHVDWAGGEWRNWTEVMNRVGGHLSNLPPGAPLIYAMLSAVLDRVPAIAIPIRNWLIAYQCSNYNLLAYTPGEWASSLLGMLMPLWAALTVVPLYPLAKRFVGADAIYCVIWFPLVPAVIGFAGSWSTVYPLIAVVVVLLLVIGLEQDRGVVALIASGVVFGVGVFINFALIPLPILVGLYMLGFILLIQRRHFTRAIVAGLLFGLGTILPWAIYLLLGGQSFFELLRTSMDFHLSLDRPYWFWVPMHLWDWMLFTGVGFAALGIAFLWRWRRPHEMSRFTVLTVSLAATMLILIFSGTARGETGRVWLFFSPFLLIVGAGAMRRLSAPRFGWLTVAQAVYMIALVASLNVMSTDLVPPPPAPQVASTHTVDATFADGTQALFRLTGWNSQVDGKTLDLQLNWQGLSQSGIPYWFGAVLVGPNSAISGNDPWQPGAALPDASGSYPTTCWATQPSVGDEIRLPLPANAAPGDWWVSLAAYPGDKADTQLVVTQPGQPVDKQVGLGPIHVGS